MPVIRHLQMVGVASSMSCVFYYNMMKSPISTKEYEWENMFPFTQISAHSFPIGKYCQEFLVYPRKTIKCMCEYPI